MITEFPHFKKLSLEDKDQVDAITAKYPPYSDFEFASMWAWDVKGEMALAELHSNLVVRFTDYLTGEPLYSFLGTEYTNETAHLVISRAKAEGERATLRLMPEITVATLDPNRFKISEDRDHFDYIYTIESHVQYKEPALKNVRNSLTAHKKRHSGHTVAELDIGDAKTDALINDLYLRWQQSKGGSIPNERYALERFLASASKFKYLAVGILFDDVLAAYSINALLSKGDCNCLFARADTSYHGIYALLMHETAKLLIEKGYQFMNYEQDLGIENLRKAKMAFHPTYFLKKYTVAPR